MLIQNIKSIKYVKYIVATLALLALVVGAAAPKAGAVAIDNQDKVTICHRTNSVKNP